MRLRSGLFFLIPAAALVLACGAPPNRHSIVIITMDTVRADHLGCYGYFRDTSPVIDSLARESIVFENCIAPMATTLPSHLSLMTGTYPVEHGVLANIGEGGHRFVPSATLRTLAEFASEAGYATAAFVSATPVKSHSGIGAGFAVFDEPDGASRPAGATTDAALRWLEELRGEPFLLWVHYFDPHSPYQPPRSYEVMFSTEPRLSEFLHERRTEKTMSQHDGREFPAEMVTNLYDGEIRYMDHEIGRLLQELRRKKAWRRTALVLVGDHGEGLGQHGLWHHGLVWREQVHVPLLIRIPGEPPSREAGLISVVDVVPTLFSYIEGIPSGPFLEQATGESRVFGGGAHRLVSQSSAKKRSIADPFGRYSLTGETWRYIYRVSEDDALYNLEDDPHELENVIELYPDTAEALREEVRALVEAQAENATRFLAGGRPQTEPLDPKVRAELEALGYVD